MGRNKRLGMGSESSEEEKRRRKKEKKAEKKRKKALKETEQASPVVSPPVAAAPVAAPPPDLSKLSVEEKRKLLGAARAARNKTAYSGSEIADPKQQAKFKKFLRLSSGMGDAADSTGAYQPEKGT